MGVEYLNFRVADCIPAVRSGQHRHPRLWTANSDRPFEHIQRRHLFTRRRQTRIQTMEIAKPRRTAKRDHGIDPANADE